MASSVRRVHAVALVVAAVALVTASVAYACAALATIQVSSDRVAPGQQVSGTGAGFNGRHHADTGQQIEITIRWDSRTGAVVWSGMPAADGTVSFSFPAPDVKPGAYVLIAEQIDPRNGNPIFGTPARQSVEVTKKGKGVAASGAAASGVRSGPQEEAAAAGGSPVASTGEAPRLLLVALLAVAGLTAARTGRRRIGTSSVATTVAAPRVGVTPASIVALVALSASLLQAVGTPAGAEDVAPRTDQNQRVGRDPEPARGKDIPGVAVNPGDPHHMVVTEEDFFDGRCEFNTSFDGGNSWTGGSLTAPPGFEGPAACARFDSGDYAHTNSSVAFGSGLNVYATFSWNRPGEGDSVLVARSTDGGRTFETATVAIPDRPRVDPTVEGTVRPGLTVVPRAEGDRIYVAAWRLTIQGPFPQHERRVLVSRSDDGGQTWSPPVDAQHPGEKAREQSDPVVAPDGTVYVAFRRQNIPDNSLVVARSPDLGATWTQTVVGPLDGSRDSHPKLAVDASSGTLYLVYQDRPFTPSSRENDVFLRRSADGGASWSPPVRISDDPVGNGVEQRLPQVAVAPNGRVDVVWHDRRHAYLGHPGAPLGPPEPGARGQADVFYAFSTDGGHSFSANRRVTDRTMSLDYGLDTKVLSWSFYAPAIASRDDRAVVVWSDAREGNYDTGTTDSYLATLRHHPAGPPPAAEVGGYRGPSFGVPLSQLAYPGGREGLSTRNRPLTQVVVVAEGDHAAALAGAVLARRNSGPVLVSPSGGVPAIVKDEIARLRPVGAYLVGDKTVLSSEAAKNLVDAGVPQEGVVRIAGTSPADTARLIAERLDPRTADQRAAGDPAFPEVVIVNPSTPEAAAAGAFAAALRLPVLFVDRDSVPQATTDALASLAVPATVVVGGPQAVSDEVLAQLPAPTRLGGTDVYATSDAVAHETVGRGLAANVVYVADGATPTDGAGAGAEVARNGGILLLAPGADPDAARARLSALGLAPLADRLVIVRDRHGRS